MAVDKVDLIIGGYGTTTVAAAIPIAMQRKKVLIGLFATALNGEFNYPNYFSMIPTGPDAKLSYTKGFFELAMRQNPKPQTVALLAAVMAVFAFVVSDRFIAPAAAQNSEPIKIGYGMALTGGLAPNGKSALLAQKIWEEDINAKGGLLGRPVKLIYYDDQANPATIPGI